MLGLLRFNIVQELQSLEGSALAFDFSSFIITYTLWFIVVLNLACNFENWCLRGTKQYLNIEYGAGEQYFWNNCCVGHLKHYQIPNIVAVLYDRLYLKSMTKLWELEEVLELKFYFTTGAGEQYFF